MALRFSQILNALTKLITKLDRERLLSKSTRISNNIKASSVIFEGDKASQILHDYFMLKNPLIKQSDQTFIVFPENVCDEQSFFEKLCAEANLNQDFPYNENVTPSKLAEKFISASNQKAFVLVIPHLEILSPRILNFIYAVLKKQELYHLDSNNSINITLVMGLEKKESYPLYIQRIVQEHSDIDKTATDNKRKLVYTDDIKDFALTSRIEPEQNIILSIISLFGNQKVSLKYLSSIFEETKTFMVNGAPVEIGAKTFEDNLALLIGSSLSESDGFIELQAPHQRPYILRYIAEKTCNGQSLLTMLLAQHRPSEPLLLAALILESPNDTVGSHEEYTALQAALEYYIANNEHEKVNLTIDRLIQILNTAESQGKNILVAPAPLDKDTPKREGLFVHETKNKDTLEPLLKAAVPTSTHQIGQAKGKGDCFFDAMAQALNAREGREVYSVKFLRVLCDDYMKDPKKNSWVEKAIQDAGENYEQYLTRVVFTVEEMEQHEKEGTLKGTATWGHSEIEGRIICESLKIKLHVLELRNKEQELGGDIIHEAMATHQLITPEGGKSVDPEDIDYNDKDILHIAVGNLHFVPIISQSALANQSTGSVLPAKIDTPLLDPQLIQDLKRKHIPTLQDIEQLTTEEKLVLSIIALLGHHRIAMRALAPLFATTFQASFEGSSIAISNKDFNEVLLKLCQDKLFLFLTEDKTRVYFPSPKIQDHFASIAGNIHGLVDALLSENSLVSNETVLSKDSLILDKPVINITSPKKDEKVDDDSDDDDAATKAKKLKKRNDEKDREKDKKIIKPLVSDEDVFLSARALVVELLLLKKEITDAKHGVLLNKQFESFIANGEYEQAYSISTRLLEFNLKQTNPDITSIFKLWQNRIMYRPKNDEEDKRVQEAVLNFIHSDIFSNIPASKKFDFFNLFLYAIGSTSIRIFGDQGLGDVVFATSQKLADEGMKLDANMMPSSVDEDAQKIALYEKSTESKHAKTLAEDIVYLDRKFDKICKSSKDTLGSYVLSLIDTKEFKDFFTANGISDFENHKKYFALRIPKMLDRKTSAKITQKEEVEIRKQVMEKREELLKTLKEIAFYKNLTILCYQSQNVGPCFGLVQNALNHFISKRIYTPDMFHFVAMILLLERMGLSRPLDNTKELYDLLKGKVEFNDLEDMNLSLVMNLKGMKVENTADSDDKDKKASSSRSKIEYTADPAKDDPLIKFIFVLASSRFGKITNAHMQMLQKAEDAALNAGDIIPYIACVFTRLKLIDLVEPNLKVRHNLRYLAITRLCNYVLEKSPAHIIGILHTLSPIRSDQMWLKGKAEARPSPLIPESVLKELIDKYEKLKGGPEALIESVKEFLTPSECEVYLKTKDKFPNYSRVKLLLITTNNMSGVSDFYYNEMQACIAENTPESIARGIEAAKVFIKKNLVEGLKGRITEAAATSALLLLLKLHYGDRNKIDSVFEKVVNEQGVLDKLSVKVVNYLAGAAVRDMGTKDRVEMITHDTPGAVHYPIAQLALLALKQDSAGVAKIFTVIIDQVEKGELVASAELITALTHAIEWCPEKRRASLASRVIDMSRKSQVSAATKIILEKYPDADNFSQAVKNQVATMNESFTIPAAVPSTAMIRKIAHVCKPPHHTTEYTLPKAILSLLTEMFGLLDIDIASAKVPVVLVAKIGANWFKLTRDIKTDLRNGTKFRFTHIVPERLSKTAPVKFLEGLSAYSMAEVPYPWSSESDPYFDRFSPRSLDSTIEISLGSYGEGDEKADYFCFLDDHPITFTPEAVHARAFAKEEARLRKENPNMSADALKVKMKDFVHVLEGADVRTDRIGQSWVPDITKIIDPCYFAALHQLLKIYHENPTLWKTESSTHGAPLPLSSVNRVRNNDDMSILSIALLIACLKIDNITESDVFEETLIALWDLENAHPEHIIDKRKDYAIKCLKDFSAADMKKTLKSSTAQTKTIIFSNLQALFDFSVITSFYDVGISSSTQDLIQNFNELENGTGVERNLALGLFINQASFHLAMEKHQKNVTIDHIMTELHQLPKKMAEGADFNFYLAANYALALFKDESSRPRAIEIINLVRKNLVLPDNFYIDNNAKEILLNKNINSEEKSVHEALYTVIGQVSKSFGITSAPEKRALSEPKSKSELTSVMN